MYKISANTLFVGQNQVFVPQCDSTNSIASELMRNKDLTEGILVITDNQTAGRGQRGNVWEAQPQKNLTLSVILKPSFLLAKDQFLLTIGVSLAIHEFLESRLSAEVKIKWPNDIMINNSKICGILIENVLSGDKIQHCIIGIGLNVNQTSFSMALPTSMRLIANQEFDLTIELNLILESLEIYYLQMRAGKYDLLKEKYLKHLYWLGEKHLFRSRGEEFSGVITGVEEHGKLNVLRDDKEISYDLKDITFVK